VESAASLLEEAAKLSKIDPFSKNARAKLIEGSRWILQGEISEYTRFTRITFWIIRVK